MLVNLQGEKAHYKTLGLASAILAQVKAMQRGMANLMGKLTKALPVCDSCRVDFAATDSWISPGTISRRGQHPQSQDGGGIPQNSFDIFVKVMLIQGVKYKPFVHFCVIASDMVY